MDLKSQLPLSIFLALFFVSSVYPSESSELDRLINSPTAGLLNKGCYSIGLRLFEDGGVLGGIQAGVQKRLTIGLSYGAQKLIGVGRVDLRSRVEVLVRYRVIEEDTVWPALAIGYESQGFGLYRGGRYDSKSKGFFGVLSKNYISAVGQFGVHIGANISREKIDGNDPTGWVGIDKWINDDLALLFEYELGNNDAQNDEGLLNLGVIVNLSSEFNLRFLAKDLQGRRENISTVNREVVVLYSENF